MHRNRSDIHDVLVFAQWLAYFVLFGIATVAVAIAAHFGQSA